MANASNGRFIVKHDDILKFDIEAAFPLVQKRAWEDGKSSITIIIDTTLSVILPYTHKVVLDIVMLIEINNKSNRCKTIRNTLLQ